MGMEGSRSLVREALVLVVFLLLSLSSAQRSPSTFTGIDRALCFC